MYSIPEEKALKGRPRKWKLISKLELYAYFGVVIYMGIIIEPVVEDYQGPIKKGTIYKMINYILKDQFKQIKHYIYYSPMPQNGFNCTFNYINELSKYF